MPHNEQEQWAAYRAEELQRITPLLSRLGFALAPEQVHVSGERYLMSGKKLVLVGTRIADGKEVIIKVSSTDTGKRELAHEHRRRNVLPTLPFAYQKFYLPEELLYLERDGFVISVTEYVAQEKNFLEHSLQEQFTLALSAFKMQEALHATARGHTRALSAAFGSMGAEDYITSFHTFVEEITAADPGNTALRDTLTRAEEFLRTHAETIEQYCGFLTHTDFVPHNLRVQNGTIYLLDHTSLQFGNKYESWARFLNYLVLYNRDLERAFVEYIQKNRSSEEYLALRLMRVYKLGFLIKFHAENLAKTTADLHALARLRVTFWTNVLHALLSNGDVPQNLVDEYAHGRDHLRSEEEKTRQRELGQLR